MEDLKDKLKKKELTIGSWLTFSDPAIAEIMAKSGFDWLVVDMEHSGLSFSQAQEIIRVIDLCNITPLVRVMENNSDLIKRFMDIGAHGVIVPLVNSRSDAEKAVNAVKYPPIGTRGVGLSRAQNYSLDLESYQKWNQDKSIVIVLLEHIKSVENLESIMSVSGIDGFIIGLYDLSGSLGVPGELSHPKVKEALEEIYSKSQNFDYLMGQHIVPPDPQLVLDKIREGIKFIGFGTDFLFFGNHIKNCLGKVRKHL
jgi:2-dehydro-3-deoxyglucarate aldolase|tara:strand:+ start:993 stop:1757 length:765 start_codon:yes stop_codon:yes gene_type:complete